MVAIMDINNTLEQINDVFNDPSWPLFDKNKAMRAVNMVPKLGVLSFACTKLGLLLPGKITLLDAECAAQIKPLIFDNPQLYKYKAYLFAASNKWHLKNRISMYKIRQGGLREVLPKEWQINELYPEKDILSRKECLFESSEGLRIAGLTEISEKTFSTVVQSIRGFGAAAIILSSREEMAQEEQGKLIYRAAFPEHKGIPETLIDWMMLALDVCPLGDILVRVSGSYVERCSSIDCIMLSEKLPLFRHNLSVINDFRYG